MYYVSIHHIVDLYMIHLDVGIEVFQDYLHFSEWDLCCRGPTRRSLGSLSRSSPNTNANHSSAHVNSNGSASSSQQLHLGVGSSQQWSPDFPAPREEKSHSKFVPMQFRTQPANLPTGMRRQSTNIAMSDVKGLHFRFPSPPPARDLPSLYLHVSKTSNSF